MVPAEEHRKDERRPADVVLEGPDRITGTTIEVPLKFACQGVNVSKGGMQILTSVPLKVGQRIKLFLKAKGGRSLTAEAEVRWVKVEKNTHRVGLMFLQKEEGFVV